MNPYQKHEVSLKSLLPTLILPDIDEMPQIILSVSPCRSGTTAMLRVIGMMGATAYFQPLKNLLRWQMQGEMVLWTLPSGPDNTIYIKETLGPYSLAESSFNPLSFLLQAGVPAQKIHVWIYGRYPLNSYASWLKWWQGKTDVDYFIATYQTIAKIKQQAVTAHITTTTLTYEILNEFPVATVISKIAQRFGLPYSDKAIRGWQQSPPYGTPASNIVLPEEPAAFITPHIHDRACDAPAFTYIATADSALDIISADERTRIDLSGIMTIYDQWQQACIQDLQLIHVASDDSTGL